MGEIKLLATDLDGTLIGSVNEFSLYAEFLNIVRKLREENNVNWVTCTGRRFRSFRDFFRPMRSMGLVPDFLIIGQAFIYRAGVTGYMPHFFWNLEIWLRIYRESLKIQDAIDEWHELITSVSAGVRTLHKDKRRLNLVFDSEESAEAAEGMLQDRVKSYSQLRVFRYRNEIDVRSVPFTKGLALSELAGHLGVRSSEILAIGNGHNDISMLDGKVTGMSGCPANSEPEVIETVHASGGHIAESRSLGGVLEIIDAYRTGEVCSDLPADWKPARDRNNPVQNRVAHKRRKAWGFSSIAGATAVGYAVLLVFANYGLIPYVSGMIMKPYQLLEDLFIKFVQGLM